MVRLHGIGLLWVVVALGCGQASEATDDGSSESRQVQAIVRSTASPFCPGKTLDSCPSPKASEWRRDINQWVGEGVPEEEIRQRLESRVPGFDLSIPQVKWGWVIPIGAGTLSTLWLILMARRFRARVTGRPRAATTSRDIDLDARLDEELAQLD